MAKKQKNSGKKSGAKCNTPDTMTSPPEAHTIEIEVAPEAVLGAGGSPGHAERLRQVSALITLALEQSDLNTETRRLFANSVLGILESLTPAALAKHCANAKGYRFYATTKELTRAFVEKYPNAAPYIRGILKGVFDPHGILHLNGGGTYFGRPAVLQEFHAHEIAHSFDGNEHSISSTVRWKAAWRAEKDGKLSLFSHKGLEKEAEGFAEFGQAILSGIVPRERMRRLMPKSLAVWESHGL